MKKLIALSILVSVFASLAFAESSISITGGAEAALVPLQIVSNEDDTYVGAGLGRPGDPEGPMVKLVATADFEGVVGLKADLRFFKGTSNPTLFGIGDYLEVWTKPVDWFKLDVGRFNEDILRGKIGDDNWHNYTVRMGGKDDIFTRFKGDVGFLAAITPIDALYIGVMVPSFAQLPNGGSFLAGKDGSISLTGGTGKLPPNSTGDDTRAAQMYKSIQVAVGYTIQDIGLVRIQYYGSRGPTWSSGDWDNDLTTDPTWQDANYTPARIEAAFAYTGMEGLVLDLGLKVHFPYDNYVSNVWDGGKEEYLDGDLPGSIFKGIQVSLGAQYTTGDIGIAGRIDTWFAGSQETGSPGPMSKVHYPFILNAHLWPSYNLGFATVGIDFGLEVVGKVTDDDGEVVNRGQGDMDGGIRVGFGAWLKKSFGNSSIKGGLAYSVATEVNTDTHMGKHPGVFSIPIVFDYSF